MHFFPHQSIGIIGLGLIGSSLARAIGHYLPNITIWGYEPCQEAIHYACAKGIIHKAAPNAALLAKQTTLIVIAAPLQHYQTIGAALAPHLVDGHIVTDVGSVKMPFYTQLSPQLPSFCKAIAGHPIAGSEQYGILAGRLDMFVNKKVILSPLKKDENTKSLSDIKYLWQKCGALVEVMEPKRHDQIYGTVSHLIQFLSYVYGALLAEQYHYLPALLNPHLSESLINFTRLTKSNPELWCDIFLQNKEAILASYDAFNTSLQRFSHLLTEQTYTNLEAKILQASDIRCKLMPAIKLTSIRHCPLDHATFIRYLPLLLATTVMQHKEWLNYVGTGFLSFTSPLLYTDTLLHHDLQQLNESLKPGITLFSERLKEAMRLLKADNKEMLKAYFQTVQNFYKGIDHERTSSCKSY